MTGTPGRRGLLARVPLYPLLFAAWPVLRLYGDNAAELDTDELLVPLVLALGLASGALAAFALVWRDPRQAAFVATALVLPLLTFGLLATTLEPMWPPEAVVGADLVVLAMWLGVVVVAAYLATRLRGMLGTVTRALNLLALVLVIVATIPVASHVASLRVQETASSSAGSDVEPGPARQGGQPARDIYHLVLDRYGSEDALTIGQGIDNSAYLESLRTRGFQVVDGAHANFERTALSLASTFDMSLLEDLARRMGPDNPSWVPFYKLVRNSPVGSMLQDLGYHYIHVGSWYSPTATSEIADQVELPVHSVDFHSVLFDQSAISLLAAVLETFTPPDPDEPGEIIADATVTQLERLHEVAEQQGGPKYVFAHILLPHEPYLFLADGSIEPEAATFATQLAFANAELDRLFGRLLDVPPEEQPIIILQADEGPYPQGYQPEREDFDWETATNEELVTKFGVLNAMYLPGPEGAEPLPDRIMLVNTYPEILARYFGLDFERAPDRILASTDDRPYDMTDIIDRVLRAESELGLAGD